MDTNLLTAARDVGGWVFAAVVVAGVLWTLFRAVKDGALVPGTLLNRALDANEKLTASVDRLTASVDKLTSEIGELRRARDMGRA